MEWIRKIIKGKKTVILYDISRVYSLEKFAELKQKGIAILRIGVEEK